jgi:hypothetical protein
MFWRLGSASTILLSPVVILTWDAIAFLNGGNASTLSRVALDIAAKYPSFQHSVCFLFGLLCAHLFAVRPGIGASTIPWLQVVGAVCVPLIIAFTNLVLYFWPDSSRKMGMAPGESHALVGLAVVIFWLVVGAAVGFLAVAQHQGAK